MGHVKSIAMTWSRKVSKAHNSMLYWLATSHMLHPGWRCLTIISRYTTPYNISGRRLGRGGGGGGGGGCVLYCLY